MTNTYENERFMEALAPRGHGKIHVGRAQREFAEQFAAREPTRQELMAENHQLRGQLTSANLMLLKMTLSENMALQVGTEPQRIRAMLAASWFFGEDSRYLASIEGLNTDGFYNVLNEALRVQQELAKMGNRHERDRKAEFHADLWLKKGMPQPCIEAWLDVALA